MDNFWATRAEQYNRLKWVNDKKYLDEIISFGNFKKDELILDLGTGTGVVAKAVDEHVEHVVGCDSSKSMLQHGKFENVSVVKCDALNTFFKDNLFDKIIARMVFHHFTGNNGQDIVKALEECNRILKPGGTLIIAESIPPSEDTEVVKFFADVRKYKEDRLTLTKSYITRLLNTTFINIECKELVLDKEVCSTQQWLKFSGLSKENQDIIWDMYLNASDKLKKDYEMDFSENDIIVKNVNLLISGVKNGI